jgi:hypothetical protein
MESHGTALDVSYQADRSQQWAIENPEEITALPPADGVTKAMSMNRGTASAVSLEADRREQWVVEEPEEVSALP